MASDAMDSSLNQGCSPFTFIGMRPIQT